MWYVVVRFPAMTHRIYTTEEFERIKEIKGRLAVANNLSTTEKVGKRMDAIAAIKDLAFYDVPYLIKLLESAPQ